MHTAPAGVPDWYAKAIGTPGEPVTSVVCGVQVRGRCWGSREDRGLVLIHGSAANGRWWDHLAPLLAEDYRVLAVDLSGHGDSGHRDSYSPEMWASEVLELSHAAGLQTPYFAIAHSLGGWVTLRAAVNAPDAIAGVVLIDSTLYPFVDEDTERRVERALDAPRTFDSEDELRRRFRVVPDDPWIQPYTLDHIARHSTRSVNSRWTWKLDPKILLCTEWNGAELMATAPCRIGLLRSSHGLISADEARTRDRLPGEERRCRVTLPETGHHAILDSPIAVLVAARALVASWITLETDTPGP